jgi:hypothetical protein
VSIVQGGVSLVEKFAQGYGIARQRIAADVDGAIRTAFNIKTTPSAVVTHGGLKLMHGVVNNSDQAGAFYELAVRKKTGA